MELLSCEDHVTISPEIRTFLAEHGIDESVFRNIEGKQGDLLLIRRFSDEDSSFLKTMREQQPYARFFSEQYSSLESLIDWRQMERDLHIRLVEPDAHKVVLPNHQFMTVADQIIHRWKTETRESKDR